MLGDVDWSVICSANCHAVQTKKISFLRPLCSIDARFAIKIVVNRNAHVKGSTHIE